MHWLRVGCMTMAAANAVLPAAPSPSSSPPAYCDVLTHVCRVVVRNGDVHAGRSGAARRTSHAEGADDEAPPSSEKSSENVAASQAAQDVDPCRYQLADPQPPASDPAWSGHDPSSGAVYERLCPISVGDLITMVFRPIGAVGGAAAPAVTPAQLAQQAAAQVKLPDPTINRSPSTDNSVQGVPYTWVNLWTWFWTSPQTWRSYTRTARAGPVWAQVTVRPDRLVYDPGDGGSTVTCAGPGRPWREADGNNPPVDGGCGYRYRHVTAGGPVTARLSIRWVVTWVGSGGESGTLPPMTTSTTSQLAVQQIQAVVVR